MIFDINIYVQQNNKLKMNQTKLVEAKKRKSQSESDIKSICFITFEYKHIENYPNKKSQS